MIYITFNNNKLIHTHTLTELMFVPYPEAREPPYWAAYNKARLYAHKICSSKYFDLVIAAVIGLNVITMAMEFYMMPDVSTS